MSELIVAVFADQFSAYEGVHSLEELHEAGNATVFGTVVLERNADGTASIKQPVREGPVGLGVGALAGAVVGLLGGPLGAAIGGAVGAAAGRLHDYLHEEEREGFIDCAYEMKVQDGTVDLAQRKARRAGVKAQAMSATLEAEIGAAARTLQQTEEKTLRRLDDTKAALQAKLDVLQDQVAGASPEVRGRIERRIAELRKDFATREAKLMRAHNLAQEALHA